MRSSAILAVGGGILVTALVWTGMVWMLGEIRFLPDSELGALDWLTGFAFFNSGPSLILFGLLQLIRSKV